MCRSDRFTFLPSVFYLSSIDIVGDIKEVVQLLYRKAYTKLTPANPIFSGLTNTKERIIVVVIILIIIVTINYRHYIY